MNSFALMLIGRICAVLKRRKRVPGWGLSPKIPQPSYDDIQHMHIGRGRRIGRARFYD